MGDGDRPQAGDADGDRTEVEREARAQGDLDDRDLAPSEKVEARDRERRSADEALGVEPPEGPNPS